MSRPRGEIFNDPGRGCLAYVKTAATPAYWDSRWESVFARDLSKPFPRRGSFVSQATLKHLEPGSHVLEGGCGTAFHSRHLLSLGYQTTALDFARDTIRLLARDLPEVNPVLGDVKSLPLADGSVDGYWSLGVIEHFYEGYDPIISEMRRVLRPGGVAFVTFPYMNPLRRLLRRLRFYRPLPQASIPDFYQFALDHRRVRQELEQLGFSLLEKKPLLGLAGLEDTFPVFRGLFSVLRRNNRVSRALNFALTRLLVLWSGHMVLLVMRKQPT